MAATRRLAVEDDVTNAESAELPFARRSTIDNIDVSILSMAQPLYIISENGSLDTQAFSLSAHARSR